MSEHDYYALIGVDKHASLHEIRSKFRAKVLAEHPDKGGDPQKFQLLNKAYTILTDQEKRRRYDSTGHVEKSAEEEFMEGFDGGRLHEPRSREADERAVVSLQDRIVAGPQTHEEGFAEWLRQRDQNTMVMTDNDFQKTYLFNAAGLASKIAHTGPVHHVFGSPKTDAYGQLLGGSVQVEARARRLKTTIDHDEVLVRMLAVPIDDSMIYAELKKSSMPLGMTGVGRIEQVGARVEDLKTDDAVLLLPKPAKYSSDRPLGTARTLLPCHEEDVIKLPPEVLEELTPEQICLAPTIVGSYTVLEHFGAKLKAGDTVLLNAAHLSTSGSSLLQLCKLLKLKALCILDLPSAPRNVVQGEWGSKSSWQDADSRAVAAPTVRAQYERMSEMLVMMGAEEVFPDAVALLRWRDRNQRMLPKLALDGISTRDSCEQLIHCLQAGDKDAQIVVYGHGVSQPIEIAPPLLAAWGGKIAGFNIAGWVHALSANKKKMMNVMENVTKLVRANKFALDTVLYKVGEDAIGEAFSRAADAADSAQVVLIFPTLQEEMQSTAEAQRQDKLKLAMAQEQASQKLKEEDERDKLKKQWLRLLFTDKSVAAMSPEGPVPVVLERGSKRKPSHLVVWVGDNPKAENEVLKDLPGHLNNSVFLNLAWSQHPASEACNDVNLRAPEVVDGSFYLRDRASFESQDLDMLHDVELLGRSLVEALEPKISECGLDWKDVIILGFGKGAGIALYAALLKVFPKPVASMILFSPVVIFPSFLGEKIQARGGDATPFQVFIVWAARNRSTPPTYRQLLVHVLRQASEVQIMPDTLPDGDHVFDATSFTKLTSMLSVCMSG